MSFDGKRQVKPTQIGRRQLLKYAGVGGLATALAGCTGDPPEENGNGGNGAELGDSLVYATTISPSTIDPMRASDNFENIYTVNVYDSLLNYTNDSPPELAPGLAEEWEVGDDDQTYEFYLREDATFHNGDPVTADDVVYSFERMHELQDGLSWMWAGTIEPDSVSAIDETTVEIVTERTFAPFLFTLPYHPIVNESQLEAESDATDWLEEQDAGSGPYELVEHEREERIVIERFDDWWGDGPAGEPFEEVVLEIVPEEGTVMGMMGDESAHITDEWLSVESYQELADLDHVSVSDEVTFSPLYVFMHTQREPLDDVNVRKAISYAVDYQEIVDDILLGNADQMQGPLPAEMWGHNDDVIQYELDFDRARDYLEQSDHDPEDIELTYTYVSGLSVTENIGLSMQTTLNEIGIDLEIESAPWTRITDMVTSQEETSDMHAIYLSFSYVDPDTFLYPAWHTDSHGSWESPAWYENEDVDRLLDDARTEINVDQRTEYYREAQEIIADEAPALFVVNEAELYGVNERVGDFVDNGLVGYSKALWRFHDQA